MTAAEPTQHTGPLALVIQPDGSTTAERLPVNPAAALAALSAMIGAHYEPIGNGRWYAFAVADSRDDPRPNEPATRLAQLLGWQAGTGQMFGAVVFLGHDGAAQTDVPEVAIQLARRMGLIP